MKVYKDSEGEREGLGASRQSIWAINVQNNGLAEWGMMEKWPSCRVALEVMYGSEDRACRSMAGFSFPSSSQA